MAEYQRLQDEGDEISLTAGATITGGQVVYLSAANTITPTSAATKSVIGVAAYNAVSGDLVTVFSDGVHQTTASGSVAAGDALEAAAAGKVATHTVGTNDAYMIGVALTAATDGNLVNWKWR